MNEKLTNTEIKKALEDYIKENEFEYFHSNTMGEYPLIRKALNYINRLEAEKKELQELVDDMSDYFPACIDCEGKTEDGVRTDKCVFLIDKTNYCVKRGISNIVAIRKENAELKAENEGLKELLDSSQERYFEISNLSHKYRNKANTAKAEAYEECIEKVKESSNKMELVCSGALVRTDYTITKEKLDDLLKELLKKLKTF